LLDLALAVTENVVVTENTGNVNDPTVAQLTKIRDEFVAGVDALIKKIRDHENSDGSPYYGPPAVDFADEHKGLTKILSPVENMKSFATHDNGYDINRLVAEIQTHLTAGCQFVVIPLLNFYPLLNGVLYKNEQKLFCALKNAFPNVGIKNFQYEENGSSEGEEEPCSGGEYAPYSFPSIRDYKDSDDEHPQYKSSESSDRVFEISIYSFIYGSGRYYTVGQKSKYSKYNDNTYDTKYNIAYTAFVVSP